MAEFLQCLVADEEGFAGCVDDFWGEVIEVVEGLYAFYLGHESVDESEVAAGDSNDGGKGCGVGDAVVCLSPGGEAFA